LLHGYTADRDAATEKSGMASMPIPKLLATITCDATDVAAAARE
jgi:hypothetical protein